MMTRSATRPASAPDVTELDAFWKALHVEGTCREIRLWNAQFRRGSNQIDPGEYLIAGFYDRDDEVAFAAKRLEHVSAYITVNPLPRRILDRAPNKFVWAKKGVQTSNEDVELLQNLFIDIDPVRGEGRDGQCSATDEEEAAAHEVMERILAEHPELRAASIWGSSGNGRFILPLIDLENTPEHKRMCQQILKSLAQKYNNDFAHVGVECHNPGRVMPLVGTLKCKGSHAPETPWRMTRLLSPHGQRRSRWEALAWLDAYPPSDLGGGPAPLPEVEGDPGTPRKAGKAKKHPDRDSDARLAKDAIGFVPSYMADEYDSWLRVGFALYQLGAEGLAIWDQWSRASAKYAPGECQKKWASFADEPQGVHLGSLFEWAKEGGWSPPKSIRDRIARPAEVGEFTDEDGRPIGRATGIPDPGQDDWVKRVEPEQYALTDDGNADRLVDLHGHRIRYCKAYGDWLIFDGRRWVANDLNQIETLAADIPKRVMAEFPATKDEDRIKPWRAWLDKSQMLPRREAAIKLARSHRHIPVAPDLLDADPWLLNVLNGTVDLHTGTLRPHHSGDLITKIAPVEFDPDAKCPTWEWFLKDIFEHDDDLIEYLQRMAGYATTGVIRQHVITILYGSGRNGKTTFVETIQTILGDYAVEIATDVIMAQFGSQHPTGLTDLEGRRFVVADESEDNARLAEGLVKKLTGGNRIRARKMHHDFYTFQSSHHMFLATNHKPDIRGTDPAIWRRIKLIPFRMCYDPKEPHGRQPDFDLKDKLMLERSGILNWLIAGCLAWQERGLDEPATVEHEIRGYKSEMDTLGWWIEEVTVREENQKTALHVLYGEYRAWCQRYNHKEMSVRRFSSTLTDRGHPTEKVHSIVYKQSIRLKNTGETIVADRAEEAVPF